MTGTPRTVLIALAAAATVVMLAACGSSAAPHDGGPPLPPSTTTASGSSGPSQLPVDPVDGVLTVLVTLTGGPADPNTGKSTLIDRPEPHALVMVDGSDQVRHRGRTGADGTASFRLMPGTYTVTYPTCGRTAPDIRVRPGRTARVHIDCPVP